MESPEVMELPPPPARIWVGASAYAIHPVPASHTKLDDARAITYFEPSEIYYDAERPAREVFECIWHELTHAVNEGFSLSQPKRRLTEERVAHVHGRAWTQVFLDNPALVEWLDLCTNLIKSEQENA